MFELIGAALATIGGAFKSWMDAKKVKQEGKVTIATAEIQAKVAKIEKEADMDIQSTSDMRYSWKDEWFTILLSLPFIGSFLPWTQKYVADGFNFLKLNTPDWYQWAFVGAIAASFGLRTWMGWKK